MNTELDAITIAESKERADLERDIDLGKKTFIKVGLALARIRDARLYRNDYTSFEKYAEARFGFKRSYAYQLIESAGVAVEVSAIADIQNEGTARALAKVAPTRRAEVLQKAVDAGPVTAKAILEAATPPPDKSAEFLAACGNPPFSTIKAEPNVTEFYHALETFIRGAFQDATDKQLVSMGVYAAMIPKLIKAELQRRKDSK